MSRGKYREAKKGTCKDERSGKCTHAKAVGRAKTRRCGDIGNLNLDVHYVGRLRVYLGSRRRRVGQGKESPPVVSPSSRFVTPRVFDGDWGLPFRFGFFTFDYLSTVGMFRGKCESYPLSLLFLVLHVLFSFFFVVSKG